MPAPNRAIPAVRSVSGTIPTIWGHLERVDELSARAPQIQVRTVLPGGIVMQVRTTIGIQTHVSRGIEPVEVSGLREGEFVEVSYRQGCDGRLEAETIYVRPKQTAVD